jgi:SAM-dependent methyltransferase
MTTTLAAKPFDPVKYKEMTHEQWQTAAQAWNDWTPSLRRWLGPATEIMLDMAKIGPGDRVLDVAAGAGDQALQAAERVGPAGYVLATDISAYILAFAAENARQAGHGNVETRVLDGEKLDVPAATFDAVISRVGLIYFPDQQKALAEMKRALKPGGRVAAIVYSTAENNKFFSIPVSIIRRRGQPAAAAPGAARPLQPRRCRCPGRDVPQGRLPRRAEPDRPGAGSDEERRRLRALREGVVRGAAPDARRARQRRPRGRMVGDRAGAARIRDAGRLRRTVRDDRRRRHQVSLASSPASA